MFRTLVALFLFAIAALSGAGCVVVDSSPQPTPQSAPYLAQSYVGCDWDGYYQDYFWYFEVQASDPDMDLSTVGVDVFDRSGRYLESWELVHQGGSTFAVTVYEYYSAYLSCPYGGEFQFSFWAQDYAGHETAIAGPSYASQAPVLSRPYVECGWDAAYGQSYWYFSVDAWDPQGLGDIADAEIWIYWAGGASPVEAFDLFYEPSIGSWYTTVYEQYSAVLDCRYPGNFGFQFIAEDYSGNLSYVNATSVAVY